MSWSWKRRMPSGEGDTLPILASPGCHTCELQYVVTDGKTFFYEEKHPLKSKMRATFDSRLGLSHYERRFVSDRRKRATYKVVSHFGLRNRCRLASLFGTGRAMRALSLFGLNDLELWLTGFSPVHAIAMQCHQQEPDYQETAEKRHCAEDHGSER
jgi:hypothetical protein